MAGKGNDHLARGKRDHLAQKGHLIGDVIEDAHRDADVESVLEVQLEEIGLDEFTPVGDPVLLRLLPGAFQHVGGEIYAVDAPANRVPVGSIHNRSMLPSPPSTI